MIAIRAERLSKRYLIAAKGSHRMTLSERLSAGFRNGSGPITGREEVWSLRDVSFEVRRGEVVGIIGPNGAGKSTLLKILSRITDPTSGRAELYGRVGTLLEVGTGFHPELTGRDNIYLSGIILGIPKRQIDARFDEIVAFSGVDQYIDTPVKRYSSGMYVRLAFAVGAHLDSEVLIVDEVLAVGDVQFQAKCLEKMQDIGKDGRTVLFVSHNMPAISRLCPRAILLDKGRIAADGPTREVVSTYLNSTVHAGSSKEWPDREEAPGNQHARLRAVRVLDCHHKNSHIIDIRASFSVELEFEVLKPGHVLLPHFSLANEEGQVVFFAYDMDPRWRQRHRAVGRYRSYGLVPGNLMTEGTFFVNAFCASMESKAVDIRANSVAVFQVVDSVDGDSSRGDMPGNIPGTIRPLLEWTTEFEEQAETNPQVN